MLRVFQVGVKPWNLVIIDFKCVQSLLIMSIYDQAFEATYVTMHVSRSS